LGDFWGYLDVRVFLNGLVKFREMRNGEDFFFVILKLKFEVKNL